ncbi:hypothetical protein [uncultured Desulfovibrio sp.]|nr:hypothetical protein [uncultured Desulfovibrio sp.]
MARKRGSAARYRMRRGGRGQAAPAENISVPSFFASVLLFLRHHMRKRKAFCVFFHYKRQKYEVPRIVKDVASSCVTTITINNFLLYKKVFFP